MCIEENRKEQVWVIQYRKDLCQSIQLLLHVCPFCLTAVVRGGNIRIMSTPPNMMGSVLRGRLPLLLGTAAISLAAVILLLTQGAWSEEKPGQALKDQVVKEPSTYAFAVWTPSKLSVTLSPGETKTVTATLQFLKDAAPPPTVVVSPELAPFVTVERDSIIGIGFPRGNTEYDFRFKFSIPADASYQTASGSASAPSVHSLTIMLNVWPSLSVPELGLTLNTPPELSQLAPTPPEDGSIKFDFPNASPALPPRITISFDLLPSGTTVYDWIQSFGVGQSDITTLNVSGRQFLRWRESNEDPASGDTGGIIVLSFLLSPGEIISVSTPYSDYAMTDEFLSIASSIFLSPAQ